MEGRRVQGTEQEAEPAGELRPDRWRAVAFRCLAARGCGPEDSASLHSAPTPGSFATRAARSHTASWEDPRSAPQSPEPFLPTHLPRAS